MNEFENRGRRMMNRCSALVVLMLAAMAAPADGQQWRTGEPTEASQEGLADLVRLALDKNRDLTAARESYVTAQEQVSEAWSSVMPSVDLNASYQRNLAPPVSFLPAEIFGGQPGEYLPVQFGADNQWNSTLSIEQPLFRPNVIVALGAARRFETLQGGGAAGVGAEHRDPGPHRLLPAAAGRGAGTAHRQLRPACP